jgi:hypothetical protein
MNSICPCAARNGFFVSYADAGCPSTLGNCHETPGVNHDFQNQTLWHLKFEFSKTFQNYEKNLLLIFVDVVLRPFFCVPRPKNWKL